MANEEMDDVLYEELVQFMNDNALEPEDVMKMLAKHLRELGEDRQASPDLVVIDGNMVGDPHDLAVAERWLRQADALEDAAKM